MIQQLPLWIGERWTPELRELTDAYMRAHGYAHTDDIAMTHVYQLLLELRAAEQQLFDLTGGQTGSNWRGPAQLEAGRKELTP